MAQALQDACWIEEERGQEREKSQERESEMSLKLFEKTGGVIGLPSPRGTDHVPCLQASPLGEREEGKTKRVGGREGEEEGEGSSSL